MYAALRTLPIPGEPVARLWHSANLLREHRGGGHIAALVSEGIGLESHALYAVSQGMPAEKFGRIHHLPAATLAAVAGRMRSRGLINDTGQITDTGRQTRERIEASGRRRCQSPRADGTHGPLQQPGRAHLPALHR
jgi:hypothetical protein